MITLKRCSLQISFKSHPPFEKIVIYKVTYFYQIRLRGTELQQCTDLCWRHLFLLKLLLNAEFDALENK